MKHFYLLFIFAFVTKISLSQNTDSLYNVIKNGDNIAKSNAYLELSYIEQSDSLIKLYTQNAIKFATETKNDSIIAYTLYWSAQNMYSMCSYRLSVEYANKALELYLKLNLKKQINNTFFILALAYRYWGYYSKAINVAQKGLDFCEANNIEDFKMNFWLVTSYSYLTWGNFEQAKIYCNKIISNNKSDNDNIVGYAFLAIGNIFIENHIFDSAYFYVNKAKKIFNQNNDNYGYALCLRDFGRYYTNTSEYTKAQDSLLKSLSLFQKSLNNRGVSEIDIFLGENYFFQNDFKEALKYYFMGQELAIKMELVDDIYKNYKRISLAYEKIGDFSNSLFYYKKYTQLKDSLFTMEKYEQFADFQLKYETEKKEKEIAKKDAQIQKSKSRQNIFIIVFFAGLLIFSLTLWAYFQKRKDNNQILAQKDEIAEKNIELEIQKNEIEKIHKQTTDSITYASRIQRAIIPNLEIIKTLEFDYSLLYIPRNIVSGDFYWNKKNNNILYFAAADCTGHGVPGAFMSILSISILNEVSLDNKLNAAEILIRVRNLIKLSLQQTGKKLEQQDGMDIALCILNLQTFELNYSGAHLPLFLFKKTENTYVLNHIPADKQPVGIYISEKDFSNHFFKIEKQDIVYLFSDGYFSQFGNQNNETFKLSRFKKLLTEIIDLPIKDHSKILEEKFIQWAGNQLQTDDILVFGIKF